MKYESIEEWRAEAVRRFGNEPLNWKFRCPMCSHEATVQDFKDAGADNPNAAVLECIGRYTGKGAPRDGDSSGCNWCAYGLLKLPHKHDVIVDNRGTEMNVFPFADIASK